MSTTQPETTAQPAHVALTPQGTPIVLPGISSTTPPPTLSPEVVALLQTAYQTIPAGAVKQVLGKNWGLVITLVTPLVLSMYGSVKAILASPATTEKLAGQVVEQGQAIKDIKAQIDALQKQVESDTKEESKALTALDNKIDRILWTKGIPTSQPVP